MEGHYSGEAGCWAYFYDSRECLHSTAYTSHLLQSYSLLKVVRNRIGNCQVSLFNSFGRLLHDFPVLVPSKATIVNLVRGLQQMNIITRKYSCPLRYYWIICRWSLLCRMHNDIGPQQVQATLARITMVVSLWLLLAVVRILLSMTGTHVQGENRSELLVLTAKLHLLQQYNTLPRLNKKLDYAVIHMAFNVQKIYQLNCDIINYFQALKPYTVNSCHQVQHLLFAWKSYHVSHHDVLAGDCSNHVRKLFMPTEL